MRKGEISPVELVEAAVSRIEKVDPELNAVIHRRFDEAVREARGDHSDGPFRGRTRPVSSLRPSSSSTHPPRTDQGRRTELPRESSTFLRLPSCKFRC